MWVTGAGQITTQTLLKTHAAAVECVRWKQYEAPCRLTSAAMYYQGIDPANMLELEARL